MPTQTAGEPAQAVPRASAPTMGVGASGTKVVEVVTPEQILSVGRLRYRVYVEEMGRAEPHADHDARTVLDPADDHACILAAFDADGEAIGTVRVEPVWCLNVADLVFHGLDLLPPGLRSRTGLTSKLMTRPEYRRGPLTKRLMLSIFESDYLRGPRLNFINCNPPLDRLFARFGFVPVGEPRVHPVYGRVQVMLLPMADLAFFRAIESPFTPLLERLGPDADASEAVRAWCESRGLRYWE